MQVKKITIIATPIIASFVAVFIYAVIHEGGHALAALIQGGKVIRFDVNIITGSPHVVLSGEFSDIGRAMINIAGVGLTYLVWLLVVPFLDKIKPVFLKLVSIIYSITFLGTLCALVALPLVYRAGGNVGSEDIVKFIQNTGANPFAVSASILILSIFSVWYLIKVGKIIDITKSLIIKYNLGVQGTKRRLKIAIIAAINVLCVVIVLNVLYSEKREIPKNYDLKINTKFTDEYISGSDIYNFTVHETVALDLIYSIKTKSPINLLLTTKNNDGFVFNSKKEISIYSGSESIRSAKFTGFILEPGEYGINLTSADKNGEIEMFIYKNKTTDEMMEFLRIHKAVNDGIFTDDMYTEKGYKLVYSGELGNFEDKIIYEYTKSGFTGISFFVVGEYETIKLNYMDNSKSLTVLENFNSTIGFGFDVSPGGKLSVSSSEASGLIYLYVK